MVGSWNSCSIKIIGYGQIDTHSIPLAIIDIGTTIIIIITSTTATTNTTTIFTTTTTTIT